MDCPKCKTPGFYQGFFHKDGEGECSKSGCSLYTEKQAKATKPEVEITTDWITPVKTKVAGNRVWGVGDLTRLCKYLGVDRTGVYGVVVSDGSMGTRLRFMFVTPAGYVLRSVTSSEADFLAQTGAILRTKAAGNAQVPAGTASTSPNAP